MMSRFDTAPKCLFVAAVAALLLTLGRGWAIGQDHDAQVAEESDSIDPGAAELFSHLDRNQNGRIDEGEIPDEKRRLLRRLLRTSDLDSDGKLNRDEFVQGITSTRPERPLDQKVPAEVRAANQLRQFLRRSDKDRDGKIVKDEVPPPFAPLFQQIIDQADTDGDGGLNQAELTRAAPMIAQMEEKLRMDKANPDRPNPELFFNRLDANADGKVVETEVPEERQVGFKRMLDRADDDGDGALNRAEFVEAFRMMRDLQSGKLPAGRMRKSAQDPVRGVTSAIDQNADGELSASEIAAASDSLRTLDRNGDGRISRHELGPIAAKSDQPPFLPKRFLAQIMHHDQDGDGAISSDEARGRLKQRFDLVDTNHDGKLTKKEVKRSFRALRDRTGEVKPPGRPGARKKGQPVLIEPNPPQE